MTTRFPLGDTASTFPVTVGKGTTLIGLAAGSSTIKPLRLPRYALLPERLNTMEFGGPGRVRLPPNVLAGIVTGTRFVPQLKLMPHCVEVTNAVVLCAVAFVPFVTVNERATLG